MAEKNTPHHETKDGFLFPFEPYDVQHRFMQNLYEVLQSKCHGIFESPTGTGKSLSLICGSLKWLKDEQKKTKESLLEILNNTNIESNGTSDWLANYAEVKQKRENMKCAKEKLDFINAHEKKILEIKNSQNDFDNYNKIKHFNFSHVPSKRQKLDEEQKDASSEEEEEDNIESEEDNEVKQEIIKIFYTSRTHSQLLQFMNELKKTPYCNNVTVTVLGSRANFCINESIKNMKKHSLINEKCSQLIKNKKKSKTSAKQNSSTCLYFSKKKIKNLQNAQIRQILDIEDLVDAGKELKACPYFSARNSISDAELIVMPYNILLHKGTRESYGISLKNSIVIVDEAHNLLDAISNMYSAVVSLACLIETLRQLKCYMSKYMSRFSPKTLLNIKQLVSLLQSCINYLSDIFKKCTEGKDSSDSVRIMSYYEFISAVGITELNVFDLVQFCEENYIGNKLMGFASIENSATPSGSQKNSEKNSTWTVQKISQCF